MRLESLHFDVTRFRHFDLVIVACGAAYVAAGLRPHPGGDRRENEWSLLALEKP